MTGDVLAQIEAVLQQVRAKVPHGISCGALTRDFRGPGRCDCDREIRVVQDQARTVERMVEAATIQTYSRGALKAPDDYTKRAWAAALRATQETK